MKRIITWILLIAFILSGLAAAILADTGSKPGSIRITPAPPKFTDVERQSELARRRAAVAAKMADQSMLILFSAEPKLYTNDVDYVYRQENNLYYLTALKQDNITLVLYKDGANVREMLFVPKRSYFAETWNGKMYSQDDAARLSGIKTLIPASEQNAFLTSAKSRAAFSSKEGGASIAAAPASIYLLLPMTEQDENGRREYVREAAFGYSLSGQTVTNARPIFNELRQIKSPYEIKLMQHAIDITTEAQMRSMAMVGRAKMEYEVQAEVEYTFRRRNADFWGYPSIVGCGPSATTLHYVEAQGAVKKGDVLLMDVGAEYDHYTADVTRTFPVSGKFSKEQAELYRIVYDAQEAAAAATRPGVSFAAVSLAADNVIKEGLFKLGLTTDKNSQQHKIWFMHGLGHWLGMNVHDVGRNGRLLEAGMVFTNEPGIYIREDALDNLPKTPEMTAFVEKVRPVFERYKNIGIRIEDDMLVTATGVEWMTKALPRKLEDIEAFMAKASKEMPYTAANNPGSANILNDLTIGGFYSTNIPAFFDPISYPNGITMRSGFVGSGRNAAYSGLSHAEHLHAE